MHLNKALFCLLSLSAPALVSAEASPWLPAPGTLSIGLSQVEQTADDFYFSDDKQDLPGDLDLSTTSISFNYGLTDSLALDAKIGYAESDFDDPGIADPDLSGSTDTYIGLTWQVVNEFSSDKGLPSIALRIGGIIEGDYDTGTINAIGDGGSGFELSVAVGKSFNRYLALSTELGYRDRSNSVPKENFFSLNAYVTPLPKLTIFSSYRLENSQEGLQIGGPGFTPDRFPEVEEDKKYVQFGAQYALTDAFSVALSGAQVIDGKNTANTDVYALNLSYTFR